MKSPRDGWLTIRSTRAERDMFHTAAGEHGLPMSSWMRMALTAARSEKLPMAFLRQECNRLQALGPASCTITIRSSREEREQLHVKAAKCNMSLSFWIRMVLAQAVASQPKEMHP